MVTTVELTANEHGNDDNFNGENDGDESKNC